MFDPQKLSDETLMRLVRLNPIDQVVVLALATKDVDPTEYILDPSAFRENHDPAEFWSPSEQDDIQRVIAEVYLGL